MPEFEKKNIALLGSTGSIGVQALEVVENHGDQFNVEVLTAHNNADLLMEQAHRFKPNVVVIGNEKHYDKVFSSLDPQGIKVYSGERSLQSVVEMETIDTVLSAMVGFAGLLPTLNAVQHGKDVALANKETLVVAGDLITEASRQHGAAILPVDSEHSAIFQCLTGEYGNVIEKIYLTASGGPFRGRTRAGLENVTVAEALKHPNWEMGAKITIDSATLMNKGLEVIEAKWLFGLEAAKIEVIVHPQSIIHSLVQFEDGSIKAQLGLPDMKLPIQYALSFPRRYGTSFPRFNFTDYPSLTFEKPDTDTFRNLALSYHAMEQGGNLPCVLNAANEIAVREFLHGRIGFLGISDLIENTMMKIAFIKEPDLDDYLETDKEARIKALELI